MANINVVLPLEDLTKSYEVANATEDVVAIGTASTIKNAFGNKENTLVLVLTNCAENEEFTIKAGNEYPNSILGDSKILLKQGTNVIRLQDKSRYEKRDGSVDIATTGAAALLATAKRAGYLDADKANMDDHTNHRELYYKPANKGGYGKDPEQV